LQQDFLDNQRECSSVVGEIDSAHFEELLQQHFLDNQRECSSVVGIDALDV
jgi:hypothetical protein